MSWYLVICHSVLFAGAFERPSFGNGEVPLWSVAVCVSGRFNNSCHRINFHSRENQDCSWLFASFASEFGPSRLAWDGACRKASLYTKFGVCLENVATFCPFVETLALLYCLCVLVVFMDTRIRKSLFFSGLLGKCMQHSAIQDDSNL